MFGCFSPERMIYSQVKILSPNCVLGYIFEPLHSSGEATPSISFGSEAFTVGRLFRCWSVPREGQ